MLFVVEALKHVVCMNIMENLITFEKIRLAFLVIRCMVEAFPLLKSTMTFICSSQRMHASHAWQIL